MKPIYYISGSKGGVGKSFVCGALLDYLSESKKFDNVRLIESDASNPDVLKSYKDEVKTDPLNLDSEDGWMDLVTILDDNKDDIFVINSAAGSNASFGKFGSILTGMLGELKREFITLWVIDTGLDCLVSLKEYRGMNSSELHVVLNGGKGDESKFSTYAESQTKTDIEDAGGKSVFFPRLAERVALEMNVNRQSIKKAEKNQPIGNKAALFQWRPQAAKMFDSIINV